ncbi:arylesterase [Pollutimonas bauzanensis]|uniref:Acyl-CoA thioesterase-1 n=1 Tax=Pollutimonas bauzanensis TaxID=658167 RepID=A0A1M5ZAQ1_9BURK|nr:arylesterase [Pollutimonas bauzanensis]SHI21316.1 acyl-CoA thioesterase-1 [Pollutimonas bauzanensis]
MAANAAPGPGPAILVIGDSLSAEYGLQRDSGWVALLGRRLAQEKTGYQIHNSSISGDTTSGGLSRLPAALARYRPEIVILELGSNDALRGLSLKMTQDNLSKMVAMSQQSRASVLLLGMRIPPNYGRQYTEQFQQLFAATAQEYKAALVPFLFEGIAADKRMFQADGMHPNEQAQATLAENVWEKLQPMLRPQ